MQNHQQVSIDGLSVGVQVVGQGIPVLLLHGWGQEIASFLPIGERLAPHGFACHILDLPGFGTSDTPPEPWDVPRYAQFIMTYLDYAELSKVNLIGHSFGGRLSIVLGADYPNIVDKIVLTDSAGVRPTPSVRMRAYYATRRVIFTLLKIPGLHLLEPPTRRWFQHKFGSPDYQNTLQDPVFAETFKRVINQDLVPYAKRIQHPTLLIWGENDNATPLSDAKILEAAIPDAGLVVFDGAGHYAYLEQPDYFVRIVSHFLGGEQ